MDRYRVRVGSVMEEFAGKCATCSQWSGARLSGLVDSHGVCWEDRMAERVLGETGEPGWYATPRDYTCEFYDEFAGIERTDGGFQICGMNPFQLIAEAHAMGFDVAEAIAYAVRDFTDGASETVASEGRADELKGLYDNIYRLNVRCDEPAYVPKEMIRAEGC